MLLRQVAIIVARVCLRRGIDDAVLLHQQRLVADSMPADCERSWCAATPRTAASWTKCTNRVGFPDCDKVRLAELLRLRASNSSDAASEVHHPCRLHPGGGAGGGGGGKGWREGGRAEGGGGGSRRIPSRGYVRRCTSSSLVAASYSYTVASSRVSIRRPRRYRPCDHMVDDRA